jgi:hypothetical protein
MLDALADVIRNIEGRLSALENKRTSAPNGGNGTAKPEMTMS